LGLVGFGVLWWVVLWDYPWDGSCPCIL